MSRRKAWDRWIGRNHSLQGAARVSGTVLLGKFISSHLIVILPATLGVDHAHLTNKETHTQKSDFSQGDRAASGTISFWPQSSRSFHHSAVLSTDCLLESSEALWNNRDKDSTLINQIWAAPQNRVSGDAARVLLFSKSSRGDSDVQSGFRSTRPAEGASQERWGQPEGASSPHYHDPWAAL